MEIRELCIIGIHTYHFFEVCSHQKKYAIEELGITENDWDEYENGGGKAAMKIHNLNLENFNKLLQETHKGQKAQIG